MWCILKESVFQFLFQCFALKETITYPVVFRLPFPLGGLTRPIDATYIETRWALGSAFRIRTQISLDNTSVNRAKLDEAGLYLRDVHDYDHRGTVLLQVAYHCDAYTRILHNALTHQHPA